MQVKYYERKRETGLADKPVLEAVFALKRQAAAGNKALKKVVFTKAEYDAIQAEMKQLEEDVNFYNMVNNEETVSQMLGVPIEVMDDIIEEPKIEKGKRAKKIKRDKVA